MLTGKNCCASAAIIAITCNIFQRVDNSCCCGARHVASPKNKQTSHQKKLETLACEGARSRRCANVPEGAVPHGKFEKGGARVYKPAHSPNKGSLPSYIFLHSVCVSERDRDDDWRL